MSGKLWRGALAVLVGLAVLAGLNWATPATGVWNLEVHGASDEVVVGHRYSVEIIQVVLASTVTVASTEMTTSEVFVAVNWQAAVHGSQARFRAVVLRTADGAEYRQLSEFDAAQLPTTAAGFTSSGVAVFELPPDAVIGAELVIGPEQGQLQSHDQQVVVDDVVTAETERYDAITLNPPVTKVTPR